MKSRWARFKSERFNVKTVQLFTFSRRQEQHKYFAFQRLCVLRKQKASLKENLQKSKGQSYLFFFLLQKGKRNLEKLQWSI